MPIDRRGFLKTGAMSAFLALQVSRYNLTFGQGGVAADSAYDFPIPYEAQTNAVFNFRRETFEPYVGGIFRVRGTRRVPVELTLVEVRDTSWMPDASVRGRSRACNSFDLLFHSNAPLFTLTPIYRLEHAALGRFELFLTRTRDDRWPLVYAAVINHVV